MDLLMMLALTSFACPLVWSKLDTSVCNQTKSNNTGPPLPRLPDQLTVQVEVNDVKQNVTIDVREWHDGTGNRGAALQWVVGVPLKFIYSYATNEMFTITQVNGGTASNCRVGELNATNQPFLFGVQAGASGKSPHIYSTARALMFGGDQQEQYVGRSTARGIPTDVWQSCVYWPDLSATMLVEWHFSVPSGWDTALGRSQIPVRCHIKGNKVNQGQVIAFEHMYEITQFRDYLEGTPAGTVCAGRKQTKPLPELPTMFAYSAEELNVEESFIQYLKKAYNLNRKFAMLEFMNPFPAPAKVRQIDDFNSGVSYFIDMVRGNCSVSIINPDAFDAVRTTSGLVRMRSPEEFFFGGETDYSYEGIRNIRGLNSEVWVGTRWGWPPNNPTNATWEYYFAMPEWTEVAGITSAHHMPISIHVTLGRFQAHQVYNLYNFRDDDPDIWTYDITSCFDVRSLRQIQMTFTVRSPQLQAVLDNQLAFRRSLMVSVTSQIPLSPIRVNRITLEFRTTAVDVSLVLTDRVQLPYPVVDRPLQEVDLNTAVQRLQAAISGNTFVVPLNLTTGVMILKAGPYSSPTPPAPSTSHTPSTPPVPSTLARSPPTPGGAQRDAVCPSKTSGFTAGSPVCDAQKQHPCASRYTLYNCKLLL
ncbi:hypothetical protein C0Q70_03413 [Pomacea canaliculata]|uniref:Uncharacterized protein n=1 Tax=Pomacea canaliculata TaxID=400727 RepID=A0A2T7PSN0_POMCA|nr:hypothetical protein C0Q70_03413 [Pomacea canaliculata]